MIKKNCLVLFVIIITCFSCSEDNDITTPRNLEDYVLLFSEDIEKEGVIACAANANGNPSSTNIFYYPVEDATDIRYYEADSLNITDENNFSNYRKRLLTSTAVFGGKLARFSRSGSDETWSIVTYVLEGKLHISSPIRHKNETSETVYTDVVTIANKSTLMPTFTWSDFGILDNNIYFQVLSDEEDNFISGIYTNEKTFTYYDVSNTDQNLIINTETPDDLVLGTTYNFTLMGVSSDNWVNLIIEDEFVTE